MPPEFQDLLKLAQGDSGVAKALVATILGVPLTAFLVVRNALYGGYDGDLPAGEVNDQLYRGNYFLIDIRSDVSAGVPDLRKGARGKAATVPVEQVSTEIANTVRREQEVPSCAAAWHPLRTPAVHSWRFASRSAECAL